MSNPFISEIRIFGGNFAPRNWAFCNGQLIPISQNTALFSLIGTFYGGNGTTNFALPNLQGKAALGFGQGPGLTDRFLGEEGGAANVTLLSSEMPAHTHAALGSTATADQTSPVANVGAVVKNGRNKIARYNATSDTVMGAVSSVGANQPHNNMPPYLVLTFIICQSGVFPARN